MGLPGPQHVSGRALVAVQHYATVGTEMGAHLQTLLDMRPTLATVLAGERRWHGYNPTDSIRCFAFEDGPKRCPVRVADTLGEMVVANPAGHAHIFAVDHL